MTLPADIQQRLDALEKLPTLPVVIENLGRALREPDVDADSIAAIIADDPAIMARILKVVNSSLYLGANETVSLKQAIVRLGFRAVSNIAMSAAVFSTFPPRRTAVFNRSEFWRHCIFTGIAAECAYNELPCFASLEMSLDELHLTGLLHDIGKIIFEQYFHNRFMQALEMSQKEQVALSSAEDRILGADHARTGAWLGRRWNLSERLLAVIRWHHSPHNAAEEHREVVEICYFANLLVNAANLGASGNAYPRYAQKIEHEFDLDEESLLKLINLITKKAEQSPLMMSITAY